MSNFNFLVSKHMAFILENFLNTLCLTGTTLFPIPVSKAALLLFNLQKHLALQHAVVNRKLQLTSYENHFSFVKHFNLSLCSIC